MSHRFIIGVLFLALTTSCGDDPPDNGPECEDTCTNVGETQCDGQVIQACAVDPDSGCLAWRSGVDCTDQSATCDDSVEPASCVTSVGTCDDSEQNQDETDVDCGGTRCSPCELGQGCQRAADCVTNNCDTVNNVCVEQDQETCTDRAQNQDETDMDCGGAICDPCSVGRGCLLPSDCQSELCEEGTCQPRPGTCDDKEQNQDETDVDCGGDTCDPCGIGLGCEEDDDCVTLDCEGRMCVAGGSCDDKEQNQDETDVDCGGTICDACDIGQSCLIGTDCTTGYCNPDGACANEETCDDGEQNQDETDVDCGGTICEACSEGMSCEGPDDCDSGFCVAEVCQAAGDCTDGEQNQDETDIDCGGAICEACPNGYGCVDDDDCRSDTCDTGAEVCVYPGSPTCDDGEENRDETDIDCGGEYCDPCGVGQQCADNFDCTTLACDLLETHTCVETDPRYLVDEDFETGDFTLFPYEFGGSLAEPHHFVIETDATECHGGDYCMRSSRSHVGEETVFMTLSLSVREDTDVTFWLKTNLETDEHYFRFYIDDVLEVERTGQNDWELITVGIDATGAGGPNRVLKWEYYRSEYVSPDHTPWYEIWVDDIDMPAWNTPPSVPELVRPTNGQLTTDPTPMFSWRSFDPDFDTITYVLEYDTSPDFPLPVTTGETNDLTYTPRDDLADGIYYWRVKSKDDSDFRWSAWSTVHAVEVNSEYEYASIWRQTVRDQFEMNDIAGVVVGDESVSPGSATHTETVGPIAGSLPTTTLDMSSLPPAIVGRSGTLRITASGDFDRVYDWNEYANVYIDGTYLGQFDPRTTSETTVSFTVTNVSTHVNDGSARITFTAHSDVGSIGEVTASLEYTTVNDGTMTSVPIRFSTFDSQTVWEKIQWIATGEITIQVLDEEGEVIPDEIIPNNSAGHTDRTIHLWDLDPMVYPVIHLQANMEGVAELEEWSVFGNNFFEWRFSNDGDTEGWIAADRLGSPSATVTGGVLQYTSTADGEDPHIEYYFPQPIDATRFTTVEVLVQTSTEFFEDDVSFWWWSNFGEFDVRRSFTVSEVFLVDYRTVEFDLTVVPDPPQEEWRGDIEAIRIDPVLRFIDEFGDPADGWFNIDSIIIR